MFALAVAHDRTPEPSVDNTCPSECLGMIGIGSSVYPPPKDLLSYVGMTKSEYKDNFNSFANNWRYCLTKSIPNLGSQVLKQLRFHAPIEWNRKYGNFLTHLVTFVGGGKNGAVYLSLIHI